MAQIIISHLPPLPDGTGTGTPKGTDLTPATDTTDTSSAASGTTKKYTRAAELAFYLSAQGFTVKSAVLAASTVALTVTYANGAAGVGATLTNAGAMVALTLDGVTLAVADRVLIKNQASQFQNGIYVVTTVGSGAVNWVLTRATDYDQAAEVHQGDFVLVNQGTLSAGVGYQETAPGPFTIGTTSIIFGVPNPSANTFTWNTITGTSQTMAVNNGYFPNNVALVTLLLPPLSAVGDEIAVSGEGAGGFIITQAASQQIQIGNLASSLGVGGSVASTNQFDSLRLVCRTANTLWTTTGGVQGNLTIV